MRATPLLAVVAVGLTVAGCGSGKSSKTTTTSTELTTTSTSAPATVVVNPPSGPPGTKFEFTVSSFKPGENATFDIDPPNGKRFSPGIKHPVTPNGTVTGSYVTNLSNVEGDYVVHAAGDQGSTAEGRFQVTARVSSGPGTTARAGRPGQTATTARLGTTATTARYGTTVTTAR